MASVFSGISAVLAVTLGEAVQYRPKGGTARDVRSIFREEPIDLVDVDGHPVRSLGPTWKVGRLLVPEIAKGDIIQVRDGRLFEVQAQWPNGSPAPDAHIVCEMFEVQP